jgi:hypothetical protein
MPETTINELQRPIAFGRIVVSLKENGAFGQYDRLVADRNTLKLVSLVAEHTRVKAIRAMFASSTGRASIKCTGHGGYFKHPSHSEHARREPNWMEADPKGYLLQHHKLEYGFSHALFISKDPNFLVHMTPDSLWETLSSDRFETPLLKEWMPWVTMQLIDDNLLQ